MPALGVQQRVVGGPLGRPLSLARTKIAHEAGPAAGNWRVAAARQALQRVEMRLAWARPV